MGPLRGWAPLGERLVGPEAAYSGGKRITMVAAMDVHGIRRHMLIDGGMKGHDFLHFIKGVLGPSLRPGKVIVMDNLRLHKKTEVLEYLERRRCRCVFVPPYSPDTNAIELAFSKIKHFIRKAMAQTMSSLRDAFHAASETITPRDARNYMRHAGYS